MHQCASCTYQVKKKFDLVRHARTGIIMSWAVPGQDGYGHINNQPKSYVIQSMKKLGFDVNIEDSLELQSNCDLSWLQNNTMVYRRRDDELINVENA